MTSAGAQCTNCGRPLSAGTRVCGSCGAPVAAQAPAGAQTMVRTYAKPKDYQRDVDKLSREGWRVLSTTGLQRGPSVGKRLMFGVLAGKRSEILVTYVRDGS